MHFLFCVYELSPSPPPLISSLRLRSKYFHVFNGALKKKLLSYPRCESFESNSNKFRPSILLSTATLDVFQLHKPKPIPNT